MGYSWRPSFDRLTARLAIGITILVIVPLAAGLYVLSRSHSDHTIAARQEAAELENRLLESALRHQMLENDSRLMADVLAEIGEQPEVRRAVVLDHGGVIRLSSNGQDVGVQIPRDSPECLACHAKAAEVRRHWIILDEEGSEVLRTVQPIENRPECHRCHSPENAFNGMLILDLSLARIQKHIQRDAMRMAFATGVLTLILLLGVGLLIRYLVLIRLARLSRTARAIAAGQLDERAAITGDDIITSLARDFNSMAEAASSLIAEVKGHEKQMAGVLNSLDDGLIVLDRDFRVVAANHSISRRLCSHPEDLQGRNCRDAAGHSLPCEDDAECPTARCLATGRLQRAVYRFPGAGNDDTQVHEVYASPVFGDDGAVAQVVEVWRDISARVQEEEHFAEVERLSALGILASGLSHEVNTPLASTLTCAESILGRLNEGGDNIGDSETAGAIRESAEIIRQQVLRCRKITEQFLRFARGIPPTVEPIDLEEVVKNVVSLTAPTAREAHIELELKINESLPQVLANTEVVQHVVLNVLVNAIESFDGRSGRITACFVVNSNVRLQIQDAGCGIPKEIQEHLFKPFRSQKPRGTGLGLFLSRTFMRRFGGDVCLVESVVGKGSCIEIVFPRAESTE
jgi:signal transduction histidine kinase